MKPGERVTVFDHPDLGLAPYSVNGLCLRIRLCWKAQSLEVNVVSDPTLALSLGGLVKPSFCIENSLSCPNITFILQYLFYTIIKTGSGMLAKCYVCRWDTKIIIVVGMVC